MRKSVVLLLLSAAACGSNSSSSSDAGADANPVVIDAMVSQVDATACVSDEACTGNSGGTCITGIVDCTSGSAVCVDDLNALDGTACTNGSCTQGECLPPLSVDADLVLTDTPVTSGRVCEEAPQFSVVGLAASTATLSAAPTGDCLVAGDEVLLINLQGAPGETANVGNWELLEVASVADTLVTFSAAKTRSYGSEASADSNIGVEVAEQKVMLARVPHLGAVTVAQNVSITAATWNGLTGGVVAFRSSSLAVSGSVTAESLGYWAGRWSTTSSACDSNVATEGGGSISGPPSVTLANNTGGAGGISAATGASFNADTPMNSTAGHAAAGVSGINPGVRTIGDAGAAYGVNDAAKLTMGSGSGGNMTCSNAVGSPMLRDARTRAGGGILLLLTGQLSVESGGSVSAVALDDGRDVASSGGYVFIRADEVTMGTDQVLAHGASAQSGSTPTAGTTLEASDGYVVVEATGTPTGTSDPAANILP